MQSRQLRRYPRHPGATALLVGAAIFVAAGMAYYYLAEALPRMDPTNVRQTERGRQLYATNCASCHGKFLEGQANWQKRLANGRLPAPPHDATGHTWHHPDLMLFRVTKFGSAAYNGGRPTDMPGFEASLSDSDIAAVLAYIKSTWPPDIQARQNRLNTNAQGR